ncbi:hypothetical protein J4Q44_G00135450 [Coregonus suidteri]|uniref:Uncharacterized protein n=1 Tax=Coregonus suidteri TaxID=861788 RepID=A0AAN8MD82_9TELE
MEEQYTGHGSLRRPGCLAHVAHSQTICDPGTAPQVPAQLVVPGLCPSSSSLMPAAVLWWCGVVPEMKHTQMNPWDAVL